MEITSSMMRAIEDRNQTNQINKEVPNTETKGESDRKERRRKSTKSKRSNGRNTE